MPGAPLVARVCYVCVSPDLEEGFDVFGSTLSSIFDAAAAAAAAVATPRLD